MVSREILNSHPISTLRKEISKTNIKGYSKMKKPEIVELMMKTPSRFSHITMKEGKPKKEKPPPKEKKKAEPKKVVKKVEPKKVMAKPKADVEPKGDTEPKRPPPKKVVEKKKVEPKKTAPKKKELTLQEQRNKMKPMDLFGQLPPELRGKIGDTALAMNKKDKEEKPTPDNIMDLFELEDTYEGDYLIQAKEEILEDAWRNTKNPTADYAREKIYDKLSPKIDKILKKNISQFIKGKKFKTAKEATSAFVKMIEDSGDKWSDSIINSYYRQY